MVTDEPRGLRWINNVNTNAFGSLVSQVCWLVGSFVLTLADYRLLREDTDLERQAGIFLAGILVTAWTGKTVAGVVDSQNKRKAHPEYAKVVEAEARAKTAGAAQALALADVAAEKVRTREHPAPPPPPVQPAVTVTQVNTEASEVGEAPPVQRSPKPEEPEWAQGDPRAGIL